MLRIAKVLWDSSQSPGDDFSQGHITVVAVALNLVHWNGLLVQTLLKENKVLLDHTYLRLTYSYTVLHILLGILPLHKGS